MATCDDRQLTEAQRVAGYQQGRTGVQQAVRPFSGRPTLDNLIDYINRELFPAVKRTRDKVNDIYLPVVDNAPSGNPLGFYFSTETGAADPTAGRIRLNASPQDTATIMRVSQSNGRLVDVAPWLDVMAGGATTPLGVVTLTDAINPGRFIRFDLSTMTDQGAYWDLAVAVIESSHDDPFVDGGAVVVSFIPGVGGVTPATVPPTSISGADGPRQFLSTSTSTTVDWRTLSAIFPGAPIYDVMAYPFNAAGNGTTDDTAALNAAIAAANAAPGVIYLGSSHRITAALTTVTGNNIIVQGRGRFDGGTRIRIDAASAADFLVFEGQYSGVQDVWFNGVGAVYTTGATVRFYGAFQGIARRLSFSDVGNGIEVNSSTLTKIEEITITDIYGEYGIWVHGEDPAYSHATWISNSLFSTNFGASVVGAASNWQAGTVYATGAVVSANGFIYQAATGGTSSGSGSGPSGIPGSTVSTAHTATITDGTVSWTLAMPETTWILHDAYADTVRIIDCAMLQGGYGVRMIDSSGGTDFPQFLRCVNLEIDHCVRGAIVLSGGRQAEFEQLFVTSMMNGHSINIESTFGGTWRFNGGVIFASGVELVVISAGDGILSDMFIGGGGLLTANTYDAVRVDANVSHFSIEDNCIGRFPGTTSPQTRYGVSIATGCDNYSVQGNRLLGHDTAPVLNTPGTSSTRIVRNNIPDSVLTEIEETGAGPFNDYDPLGAHHIMCSNAAGVFTGVVSTGIVGDTLIFSHQGTGYTEFQHNTGSSAGNVFFTGRLGRSLRIYDNEIAVFRLVDTVSGASTTTRWELQSPSFPFAHGADNALGDVIAHNGTNYVVVSGGGDASVVLRGDATFGAVPATAIAEVEETGAGPFNDYAPATANARHIMCSNAAGVFTGVAASGYVVGDFLIFSHQGTGYTEFQHNTGSSAANAFFTGRQGRALRIFDNEIAVFRYVDTVSGGTTTRRWQLQSPLFPWAQSSADAAGDVTMHNGTNYVAVQPYSTSIVRNGTTVERAALTGEVTASQNSNTTAITRSTNFTWTGVHSHTGTSHTINVTGAVAIDADATSNLTTSVGNMTVSTTAAAGLVTVQSRGGPTTSGAEVRLGQDVNIEGSNVVRISTGSALTERLEFEPDGAWQVAGDTGTTGEIFMSQGNAASPIWASAAQVVDFIETEVEGRVMTWTTGPQNFLGGIYNSSTWQLDGIINPSIAASQNDWSPTGLSTCNVIRVDNTSGGILSITGIAAQNSGRLILLINISGAVDEQIELIDESASSTAANRIVHGSASLTLQPDDSVMLWYDNTSQRWRPLNWV